MAETKKMIVLLCMHAPLHVEVNQALTSRLENGNQLQQTQGGISNHRGRQTGRQAGRQTDRQTDTQTHRQTDTHAGRHTQANTDKQRPQHIPHDL